VPCTDPEPINIAPVKTIPLLRKTLRSNGSSSVRWSRIVLAAAFASNNRVWPG
jgi:hypothetical protein